MEFICAKCGKTIKDSEIKGTMKHPYCEKCFKEVFNNDYDKYNAFLTKIHPV